MKKNNIFFNISIFFNIILIFFGNYFTNLYYLQIMALIFVIISYMGTQKNKSVIEIKKDSFWWLVFVIYSMVLSYFSIDIVNSIRIIILILLGVLIKIFYEKSFCINWKKTFVKGMYICSSVYVIFTILQLLMPNFIYNINTILLKPSELELNVLLFNNGAYAGITGQTGLNAFFITIFIVISFLDMLFKKKNKKIYIILFLLGLLALILTGKRGMLIFTCITVFLIYIFLSLNDLKHFYKYILIFIISIGGIIILLKNIPQTSIIMNKFLFLSRDNDILNGRQELWNKSMQIFDNNKFTGIGIGTIADIIGDYSHNVYIQIMAEIGIIGIFLYILAVFKSLECSIKKLKKYNSEIEAKRKKIYYILFSISMQTIFIFYSCTGNPLYSHIFLMPYLLSIAIIYNLEEE